MKLTKQRLKEIIKEEYQQLNEYVEYERLDDLEARIFDQIIEFKKAFEKSDWKKNRQVNAIIKQFVKLEVRLAEALRNTQK